MSTAAHPEGLPVRQGFSMPTWGKVVVALLVIAAAVAVGFAIGESNATTATAATTTTATAATSEGLANAETTALVDDVLAAWSEGSGQATAAYFTTDAVVYNDIGGYTLEGQKAIAKQASSEGASGVGVRRTGPVVQGNPSYVSAPFQWSQGSGIIVYEIRFDKLIANMWIYGY